MNTQELIPRLKRELTRNPKKTGALALLFLVAAYFWAPLVLPLGGGAEPGADFLIKPSPGQANAAPAASATPGKSDSTATDWISLIELRRRDALTRPAVWTADSADPFRLQRVEPTQTPQRPLAQAEPTPASSTEPMLLTAADGVKLTAIVVGRSRRWATINGRTIPEGEEVEDVSFAPAAEIEEELEPLPEIPAELELPEGINAEQLAAALRQAQGAVDAPAPRKPAGRVILHEVAVGHVLLRQGSRLYEVRLEQPRLAHGDRLQVMDHKP